VQYVRATVAYDGTDFLGFQLQAKGRTVQGVIETALCRLTGSETRVVGSGRTDAGVHAMGQVVAFHTSWRHDLADLHRALNAVLPADIAVDALGAAIEGWHPRFSAKWRHYRYTILNRSSRSPLMRRYAHLVTRPLRMDLLQGAADSLLGEHDFASFGRPMQAGETTVRVIHRAEWSAVDHLLTFDVVGNAFLRGMVRALVGNMLRVGSSGQSAGWSGDQWTVEWLAEVLAARDRRLAAAPAPACGLCLVHVEY
jgi:tRNA pseudouridine38-40 synthase